MHTLYKPRKPIDWVLVFCMMGLLIIGFINLYSITRSPTAPRQLFVSQLGACGVGLVLIIVLSFIDLAWLRKYTWWIYGALLLLLVGVLLQGRRYNGASRWLQLGFLQIQPSEFVKISLILLYARLFSGDSFDMEFHPLPYALAWQAIWVVPFFLIQRQPDLTTAGICALIAFSMFFLVRLRPTVKLVVLAANGVAVGVMFALFGLSRNQHIRVKAFLNPDSDPNGLAHQASQGLSAVRNGHLLGKGFLHSEYLRRLAENWSDFPFAVWAEEWGFVGAIILLLIYLLLILWLLRLASETRDRFSKNILLGCVALFFWHVLINVSMVLGLMPVVGVTLPLISHGGSSAITILVAFGLCINISMRRHAETRNH